MQRVYGTPGASLHTARHLPWAARAAGIEGEARVAQELERLAGLYPNMYVFYSVRLPGKTGDIDHLVIQDGRMLSVDSKNWRQGGVYHVHQSTFDADYVLRNGRTFPGGKIHLTRQIAEWQIAFMDCPLTVHGALVVANRESLVSQSINAPYVISNIAGLANTFRSLFNDAESGEMHPYLLGKVLSMVQSTNTAPRPTRVQRPASLPRPVGVQRPVRNAQYVRGPRPVRASKPTTVVTKRLVA